MLSSPPIQINGKSMSRKYPHQTKREAIGIRQIHDDIPIPPDSLSVLSEKVFSLSANGQRRTKFKPKPNQRPASLMTKYCRHTRDNAAPAFKYRATPHPHPKNATIYILYLYSVTKCRGEPGDFRGISKGFQRELRGISPYRTRLVHDARRQARGRADTDRRSPLQFAMRRANGAL